MFDSLKHRRTPKVCVIGAGQHFLSGLSYYTLRLSNAFAKNQPTCAVLMRRLLPARLYPGYKRVGANLSNLEYDRTVKVFNGLDWFWLPSLFKTLYFLWREKPDVLVFQWWSGTVVHSYLALGLLARLFKKRIVVEFHEIQDPGEAEMKFARYYVRFLAPWFMKLAHGFVIHAEADRQALEKHYKLGQREVGLIQHGPYDHYNAPTSANREAPADCCNLLFFGLIRPYKGLDILLKAFEALPPEVAKNFWLTIVGETWENWTLPAELIAQSRYRDRITFVNRYVSDAEAAAYFAGADGVVLPYRRSSGSGALHIALSQGLPVIVSAVGGLQEAVENYNGALLVPAEDVTALQEALQKITALRGQTFTDGHSWEQTVESYNQLFARLDRPNLLAHEEALAL